MTMISCAECGASVSTNAKTCPNCGVSRRHFAAAQKKRGLPKWLIVIIGLIAFGGVVQALGVIQGPPVAKDNPAAKARSEAVYLAVHDLKSGLRDPGSLSLVSVLVDQPGETVCLIYRARNGFGGLNLDHMVVRAGEASTSPARWNKRCSHQSLIDMTFAANAMR